MQTFNELLNNFKPTLTLTETCNITKSEKTNNYSKLLTKIVVLNFLYHVHTRYHSTKNTTITD